MHSIPFCDADYCAYCDWGYRKRTRHWKYVDFRGKLGLGPGCCPNMDGKLHKTAAQQGKRNTKTGLYGSKFSQKHFHKAPRGYVPESKHIVRSTRCLHLLQGRRMNKFIFLFRGAFFENAIRGHFGSSFLAHRVRRPTPGTQTSTYSGAMSWRERSRSHDGEPKGKGLSTGR